MWKNPNRGFNSGLNRYQNIWNRNFSFNILNCGIGGEWRAHNLPALKSVRNIVMLSGTNNLNLDAPEDITDGIIEIESTFKKLSINVNVFCVKFYHMIVTGRQTELYKNEILKLKCVRFSFSYIGQDTD